MKAKHLKLATLISFLLVMIGCTDDNIIIPPKAENKALAVTDTVCLMFKSMNGSSEGGVEGIETSKYRQIHNSRMNGGMLNFGELVRDSYIIFIEGTDSVKINGFMGCAYITPLGWGDQRSYTVIKGWNAVCKYKFEGNALRIQYEPYTDSWITLGYGNKEKIEVYIENKHFYVEAMYKEGDYISPEAEELYFWEAKYSTLFSVPITITAEQANTIIERQNWQDFFDEVSANWYNIPIGQYYAETFKSAKDLKHKFQGASWSIHKMTYLPKTIAN